MKTKTAPKLNEKISRLFSVRAKSINEESRTVDFVFSDDSVDRYGEKVDQSTWDVKNYNANPVLLWGHDPSQPENVLGTGGSLKLNQPGEKGLHQSLFTAQFDDAATNPKADLIFKQVKNGTLRTVSVGFIPHSLEWEDDIPVLKDNELLEISIVAIPANRNAVALGFKSGEINRKDATFLLQSMKDGAEVLEKALEDEEKTVTTDESIKNLTELITTLATSVGTLTDEVQGIKKTLETKEEPVPEPAKDDVIDQSGAGEELDLDDELSDEELENTEIEDTTE